MPDLKLLSEIIVDDLPMGVVILDRHGVVLTYNRYEEALARRQREDVIGRHFFEDVARCTNIPAIAGIFAEKIDGNTLDVQLDYRFGLPFLPAPRDVELILRSFQAADELYGAVFIRDVTERKAAERERDRLLAMFMHDLRNPLSAVSGFAELLQADALPAGERPEALRMIADSADNIRSMIERTLEESRGRHEAGVMLNLNALILSCLSRQLGVAAGRGVRLHYQEDFQRASFPERAVPIVGQVDAISRALDNVITNAVKYARSRVEVVLLEQDGVVAVEVHDDGAGIAEEHQARIFEEGYQAPGALAGFGLGLFTVKQTVERHHGRIIVESEPGRGTTMRLVFPQPPAPRE